MKKLIHSPIGLKAAGSGPKIFKPVFFLLLAGVLLQLFFPSIPAFSFLDEHNLKIAGWVWMFPGLLIYFAGMVRFLQDFSKGSLITGGAYRLSRNPIYASWIIFILPGLSMVCNNWIFLTSSYVMFIALDKHIGKEESELEKTFGKTYTDYCQRVRRIF